MGPGRDHRSSGGAPQETPNISSPPPFAGGRQPSPRSRASDGPASAKTLFSRYYLDTRLPDHPGWQADPRPAFDQVRALWQTARELGAGWNEAQTEDEFVRPILKALDWAFVVQPKSVRGGQLSRPDYALFAGDKAKREAQPLHAQDEEAFYRRAPAIAEAKYWGRPLSHKDASGRSTWKADSNPSLQMVSYLHATRVPWGILTNGRTWRLYSREVSSVASEFYEVDLGLIFDYLPTDAEPTAEQLDAFRRWWLFFRRESFAPDTHDRSFVERVHEGSATYAREISDKLKDLVFKEVVPEIAGGFVAYRHHERAILGETDAGLREVYAATLNLLYKLLFLLYAEARGLLPMSNAAYREQSLTAVAEWAAARLDARLPLSEATHATARYEALLALFHRIDRGDPSLGIPRYDGGLFDRSRLENRFLEEHKLSDRTVARAVDVLVRDAGQPVDYAYISVRNLGAIYEGLLENRLRVVDAAAGKVELVNDRGERKASGSYYTPDYIVEYIVRRTLDPVLDGRQAVFETAMERCASLRRELQRAPDHATAQLLRERLDAAERETRESFLGIKVCDAAMGSGHFLVNAVDHLTDGIIQRLQAYHNVHPDVPWDWDPVQRLVERVRADIVAEMGRQGIELLPADTERLDDTALLTRLVMKRCIYGVDLNPLAVDLAKLSLWLHSFTVGAPLSFLDHHLRWGNSLLGTDVRTVERAIQQTDKGPALQLGLFAGPFAGLLDLTAVMTEVAGRADATLADVRQSADEFAAFQRQLVPYKQILDLWVSQFFGNKAAVQFLTVHGGDVLPALRGDRQTSQIERDAIERARELWQDKRFFHWDLEFPEVFVDLHKRDWAADPGFDAVIGNPPYVRQEQLTPNKPWYQAAFAVYHGVADLYAYFYERGVRLLRRGGRLGLITSNKFVRAGYGEPLRRFLGSEAGLEQLVDFGHAPIFEDADTFPCIAVLRRPDGGQAEPGVADVCPFPREELGHNDLEAYVRRHGYPVPLARFGAAPWSLDRPDVEELMDKIRRAGVPLREFVGSSPFCGIKTGLNEAFLIDSATRERLIAADPTCTALIRPYLRGQDIKRWAPEWAGLWMMVLKSSENQAWPWSQAGEEAETVFARSYPSLYAHVKPLETALRKRQDKGRFWWELRSCAYYEAFSQAKIAYQEIQYHAAYSFDQAGYLTNNKVFLLPTLDRYLLAVLNSPLMWWCNWRYLPHMKDEALNPKGESMEVLPIVTPVDALRVEVEPAVERLIALTGTQRAAAGQLVDWLRVEFGISGLGPQPAELAALDEDAFVREASRRRPKAAGHLSPGDVSALRTAYGSHVPPLRAGLAEAQRLEQRLATLVNAAYGLTAEDVALMWRTAPPRMPTVGPVSG